MRDVIATVVRALSTGRIPMGWAMQLTKHEGDEQAFIELYDGSYKVICRLDGGEMSYRQIGGDAAMFRHPELYRSLLNMYFWMQGYNTTTILGVLGDLFKSQEHRAMWVWSRWKSSYHEHYIARATFDHSRVGGHTHRFLLYYDPMATENASWQASIHHDRRGTTFYDAAIPQNMRNRIQLYAEKGEFFLC